MLTAAILASSFVWAQDAPPMMQKGEKGTLLSEPIDSSMCTPDGVSLGGYDVVSYRKAGGPTLGSPELSAEHEGDTYYFSRQAHLTEFNHDPDRYVPAYSGFCAITLALGRVTCPEYTNFAIQDDHLLLFEITGFTNGRTLWNTNPSEFRSKADSNFEKIILAQ